MSVMRPEALVLTGGSGFVGGLIAAALLVEQDSSLEIVLPVRAHHTESDVIWPIEFAVGSLGHEFTPAHRRRLRLVRAGSPEELGLANELDDVHVREVVHCAGCLDYFDKDTLHAVNVVHTEKMIDLARRRQVSRFTYISTAYSCGYISGTAPESRHGTPPEDPTDYTRTKREAEWLVVNSGLPFHVIRPSVLIGTSGHGSYTGKRYGLYQLWNGLERLMCRTWIPLFHAVAPNLPAHLVHQDSFQRAYLASRRHLPSDSFLHVTTPRETAPTLRQMWDLWIDACARPERVIYYDRPDELPMREIDPRQRGFLSLAWTNLNIASRHWDFATDNLQRLRDAGLDFRDVTAESLETCQRRFIEESQAIQKFLQRYEHEMARWPRSMTSIAPGEPRLTT
jgi:nucleoside-diphosphate-sugar epimerase